METQHDRIVRYDEAGERVTRALAAVKLAESRARLLVSDAEAELRAAEDALAEYEVSPGIPKPEFRGMRYLGVDAERVADPPPGHEDRRAVHIPVCGETECPHVPQHIDVRLDRILNPQDYAADTILGGVDGG